MPTREKSRSRSRTSAPRRHKRAIVQIHTECQQAAGSTIDFDSVRQEITKRVVSRALELVDDMMQHVKDGNFQAMKYLFEAVGLLPIKGEDAQPAHNELGKKLSDLLEKSAQPETGNSAPDTGIFPPAVK